MKVFILIGTLFFSCWAANAQSIMRMEDKTFNWGAKVGLNASFPAINSLSINDVETENVHIEYKIGYSAAFFCRINIERFFLQPSFGWHRAEGDVRFSLPATMSGNNNYLPDATTTVSDDRLRMRTNSLEMPIMVGYNWVKKGPYGLSFMVGPKLKYNYKTAYTYESATMHIDYENDNSPFGINISAGIGVSIGRLFFDFVYEFGLNESETDFKEIMNLSESETHYDIRVNKRTNVMSMSLGFLF